MLNHFRGRWAKATFWQHVMGFVHNAVVHPLEFMTYFSCSSERWWNGMHNTTEYLAGYNSDPWVAGEVEKVEERRESV